MKESELKMLLERAPDFGQTIRCPVCLEDYNHPQCVVVTNGDDTYSTDGVLVVSGNKVESMPKSLACANRTRGNDFFLIFDGECGHRWARRFMFHKGIAYMDDMELGRVEYPEEK